MRMYPLIHTVIHNRMLVGAVACTVILSAPAPALATGAVEPTWTAGFQQMVTQYTTSLLDRLTNEQTAVDAENQAEIEIRKNARAAQTQEEMTPGELLEMTASASLGIAESEIRANGSADALGALLQKGDLGSTGAQNFAGDTNLSALQSIRTLYCDPNDNDQNPLCQCDPNKETCSESQKTVSGRYNRDIDFDRLIGRNTLDINFADGVSTPDESDIQTFLNNVTPPLSAQSLAWEKTGSAGQNMAYMRFRDVVAKRNVARNSLTRIIGSRSSGSEGSKPFMQAAMVELGMSEADAKAYLNSEGAILTHDEAGDKARQIAPSYQAQMEILTKKMYQSPQFYTRVFDTPANVLRAQATLQAARLMQRRDMYETLLRREILLSQLLDVGIDEELAVMKKRVNLELTR